MSVSGTNKPSPAGSPAALDIEQPEALDDYLRRTGRIGPDETIDARILAGGVSNRAVLVTRATGEAWVIKQALEKLRVQADWFSDPARIHREALGMRWLARLTPPGTITPFVFEDLGHHLLAMQAVPQPHDNWKSLLLAGRVDEDYVAQFGAILGTLHRRAHEQADELSRVFDERSFFWSLRIEPYYQAVAASAGEFMFNLISATVARRFTVVHGDYSPKNILVHHDKLVLLDHEVIHWGDPAFDLGFAMTHLLSKAHHLPEHRDRFAAAVLQFWNAYTATLGDVPWSGDLESHAVRHTLGCLLARVAGRSPLEYLGEQAKQRQAKVVLAMMEDPPEMIAQLTEQFVERLQLADG